ncbi:MAG TPA: MFS transporter [Sneathiellales bacterium]|nr:MFS transporter [Sneathiellales bacterium]
MKGTQSIFYGWIIVGLTGMVMTTAYGAQFSFGVFLPHIEADTSWDRELLSRAFAIYIFMYAFLSLISGPLTDRYGPRPVVMTGGILLGLGYWLLGRADSDWELFVILGAVSAAGMSAAFVPCNATVVRWFVRYRGESAEHRRSLRRVVRRRRRILPGESTGPRRTRVRADEEVGHPFARTRKNAP